MLAPAMIPVAAGKKTAKTEKKVSPSSKCGNMLNMATFAEITGCHETQI